MRIFAFLSIFLCYSASASWAEFDTCALKAIKMTESSGGKNIKHKLITNPKNINYGTYSRSKYGLMPLTIKWLISRYRLSEYNDLLKLKGNEFHNRYHTYQGIEERLSKLYYNFTIRRLGRDINLIAYSWFFGINAARKHLKLQGYPKIYNHWHTKKVRSYFDKCMSKIQ